MQIVVTKSVKNVSKGAGSQHRLHNHNFLALRFQTMKMEKMSNKNTISSFQEI